MKKGLIGLLVMSLLVGISLTGCGNDDTSDAVIVGSNIEEEIPEVTIIDDNGGEVVNELLEDDREKDPVSAELMEEEEEPEPIIPSEAKEEDKKEEEKPIIDPVTEAEVEPDDIVVDVTQLNGHQENMLILMDALNMCLVENGYNYDITDTEFFWNALNYTIMTYPEVPGTDSEEMLAWNEDHTGMKVHQDLVKVYAEGLFADYVELPEVPGKCMVSVSDEEGYYNLSIGDRGTSYGEIVTWVQTPDGSCHVEARLSDAATGETIVTYVYELVENKNEDAVFAYRIKSAKAKGIANNAVSSNATTKTVLDSSVLKESLKEHVK